ncbi:MAG TPA: hypothetical protein VH761_06255, partial [Ilumatobacteraceae bacterium]
IDRRYGETTVLPVALAEVEAAAILPPVAGTPPAECRDDLIELDGRPLPVLVDAAARAQLLAGDAVDVTTCDAANVDLVAGSHRVTTAAGHHTGIDVDRIVFAGGGSPTEPVAPPQVRVDRTRTSRTATVDGCPTGCWLILGEGYNSGWKATLGGDDLGPPRQISGGFNGWWLPGSASPMTVTMHWAPQRTMWAGMLLAGLAIVACALLIWRDRAVAAMPTFAAPMLGWPTVTAGRRAAAVAAAATTVLAVLVVSPKYGALAACIGIVLVLIRRPVLAGVLALALVAGLAALIVRRQARYHLIANPSWPAAFDDLHRLGLLAVVLLLGATILDEYQPDEVEQVT